MIFFGGRVARWTQSRGRACGDDGTSLMELIVGMAVMAVFMAIFTGAIVSMTSTANKVEATTLSAGQTNQAFLRLDKSVRYAGAISTPGKSTTSGDWYVELDTPPPDATQSDTCTQLRIDSQQLQQRTWLVTGGTATTPSSWTPLASFVTNGAAAAGSADVPFAAPASATSASTTFQRLQIVLLTTASSATTASNRAQMTFTALNSSASAPGNATTCQQGGRP